MNKIIEKWTPTGLLRGAYDIDNLALCLESQRLYNQYISDLQFRRLIIPIIRRVLQC